MYVTINKFSIRITNNLSKIFRTPGHGDSPSTPRLSNLRQEDHEFGKPGLPTT